MLAAHASPSPPWCSTASGQTDREPTTIVTCVTTYSTREFLSFGGTCKVRPVRLLHMNPITAHFLLCIPCRYMTRPAFNTFDITPCINMIRTFEICISSTISFLLSE